MRRLTFGIGLVVLSVAACAAPEPPRVYAQSPAPASPAPMAAVAPAVRPVSVDPAQQATAAMPAPAVDFPACAAAIRSKALGRGISPATVAMALDGLQPDDRVLTLDRKQPEFVQTFWQYLSTRVSADRIERGRRLLGQHAALLNGISQRYGVQPQYLVAFWGLESNFGDATGNMPVIRSLVTLACDPRRASFFEGEALNALQILDEGHMRPERMTGSWAGAMGQTQFMPTTFLKYSVDGDGDGRRDLWSSLPDIFASSANYLHAIGWRADQGWGTEVVAPPGFDWAEADPANKKPLAAWRAAGFRLPDGGALPDGDIRAALILPAGYQGPAFLTFPNFDVILKWNRSISYALAVGLLADRYEGKPGLSVSRPADDQPLRRDDIVEIQTRLQALGFYNGTPDGAAGPVTQASIRNYQKAYGLPADGYPSRPLLDRLRQGA